ncbi:MAG: hypothetical protein Q7S40_08040 [Opitutaceae bacterium]|nr:hypothetical protein [Opitutaceae bacterium]
MLAVSAGIAAPSPKAPDLAQVGLPDAAETAKILEQFRQAGIPGEYYLEFQLVAMPRRGETKTFNGRLWGSRNEQGAISRVEVTDAQGGQSRLLIQNGERATVWRFRDGKVTKLDAAAVFAPLIPGIEITAFDLQMPYVYWPDAKVQAVKRVLGRPAHAFLFRAPGPIAQQGKVGAVRAYLDTVYNAMTQTELLDASGRIVKTFSLVSLKTVDHQALPKSVDFRNDVTRDKTRMTLTAAALRLDLGPAPFSPEALAEEIRPPATRIIQID